MNQIPSAGAIVFTDIVGFTELTDRHGDDAAVELVERHVAAVRSALPPSGRIVKELGDGVLVWTDDPIDAVCAAASLRTHADGVHDTARSVHDGATGAVPLWVRIGIHWGAPRRRGDDIIGRDVNLASRVADLAAAGEALCTGQLVEAVDRATSHAGVPGIGFEFVGAVFVKGVTDPVPVHRLVSRPDGTPSTGSRRGHP